MGTGIKDGRTLWQSWQMLLDQTLAFKNSQRFAKMTTQQKEAYKKTMHQRLQAINEAAHKKDMDYINRIKKTNGIQ